MKFALRENINVESFSDGEMVVYDQETERIHTLNVTAALALETILNESGENIDAFVEKVLKLDPEASVDVVRNDYVSIMKAFLDEGIIVER